jgi:hypothetical protein
MNNVIKTGQQLWIGNFKSQFHALVLASSETEYRGKIVILTRDGFVREKNYVFMVDVFGKTFIQLNGYSAFYIK